MGGRLRSRGTWIEVAVEQVDPASDGCGVEGNRQCAAKRGAGLARRVGTPTTTRVGAETSTGSLFDGGEVHDVVEEALSVANGYPCLTLGTVSVWQSLSAPW